MADRKRRPKITWKPAPIHYGMPLDATHLNAEATHEGKPVTGKFKYSHAHGTMLPVGKHSLRARFEPDDDQIYVVVEEMQEWDCDPTTLTVSGITANDKTYDGTTNATLNAASGALVGVVSGDDVTLETTEGTGAFADRNVGSSKTVTVSGLTITGKDAGNYTLMQPMATASVTAAALAVSGITASNKAYDGTTNATLDTTNAALVGVVSGDTVTLDTAGATGAFADKNVGGNKPVTVSGLTIGGVDAGNYTLIQPTVTASITPPQVTGKVTFAGQPLAGLLVTAVDPVQNVQLDHFETLADGSYTLTVPAENQVRVDLPLSFTFNNRNVFVRGPKSIYCQSYRSIALPDVVYELRGCLISGSVQRQIAGTTGYEPFAGVPIDLVDPTTQAILDHQNTDAQGDFCFLSEKTGLLTLEFAREMTVNSDLLSPAEDRIDVFVSADRPFELPAPVTYAFEVAQVIGQVNDGKRGLEGVSVQLFIEATNAIIPQVTDATGFYTFPNLPPGTVELSFPSTTTDSSGQVWQLQPSQPNFQSFDLSAGDLKNAASVSYQPEQHVIQWSVTVEGRPAPGKLVEVWSSDEKTVIAAQRSKDDGTVYFKLDQGGDFLVKVYPDDRVPGGVLARHVSVHSTASGATDIPPSPAPAREPGLKNGEVRESVVDLQAYPVLTEEVPSGGPAAPTAVPSAPGIAPLGLIAQNAIRDVLSWRTKPNDPKSFVMALNQSFVLKDVEGHTEVTWTPRSYTVQTDLGTVTGAQASIYTRAKVALDQSLPLLDGLYPLLPEVLPEDLESIRSVVRSLLTSLVNEFGVEGGPRVPRVDELFVLLIGPGSPTDPEHVGGRLADLQNRFGLKRQFVTTIEDEQNLTNYLILVDYVTGLNQSWNAQRGFFSRNGSTGEPFFGTQLVLLSRALDVVAQSVKDAYFTLDSVFLGAAERQTIPLTFSGLTVQVAVNGSLQSFTFPPTPENPTPTSSLFVAELLDWVDRAASDELPRLVQDAGKDSISSMVDILDTLRKFSHAAVIAPFGPQPTNGLPPGYRTPRVQRALIELADQLDEAFRLASQIKSPRFPAFNNSSQGTRSGAGGRSS